MPGPESKLQTAIVTWAREKYKGRLIARKVQAGRFGSNGWPDYEFLTEGGGVFHLEFKRPGGKCTDLQLARHAELRALGHQVFVVDDITLGKQCIRTVMDGRLLKVGGRRGAV